MRIQRNGFRRAAVLAVVNVFLFLSTLALPARADEVAIPSLTARVTDVTGTLNANDKQRLETAAAAIEADKGAQVAILMLPTTQPETIEQFGIRVAEAWKVGRQGVDDGVIIIVAKDDRAARIEVGYGLEGAIPDAVAKRVVSDIMVPRFKQGDFAGGLDAAVDALGRIIRGEALPAPERRPQRLGMDGNLIPVAMIFIFVVGGILRAMLGRAVGAGVSGTIAFFGAWLLLGSALLAVVIAVIAFVFTLGGGGRFGGPSGPMGPRGPWGGGGFGGGGGFSGGGGSFGGGGASGRW